MKGKEKGRERKKKREGGRGLVDKKGREKGGDDRDEGDCEGTETKRRREREGESEEKG